MIECTFQHITSIARKGEIRLWRSNIVNWKKLIATPKKHPHFTKRMWKQLKKESIECQKNLEDKNYFYFLQNFPEELHWRLLPNLIGKIVYFDVEMTGLDIETDTITTIAAYDGNKIKYFVKDINLDEFPEYINNYPAICTFDGTRMDFPFIEKELNMNFCHIHFDLFPLSRRVRLSGGLKQIERILGIKRKISEGINGEIAIYLWKEYKNVENEKEKKKILSTLLAYNIEDTLYLERILFDFYEKLRKYEKLPAKKLIFKEKEISIPLKLYPEVIDIIYKKYPELFGGR